MSDPLADAVAELYRLPPEEFVSARAERVKTLRDSGDSDAAKQVAALRKPTVGAWLVNLLVADEPTLGEQMTALADQLRTAQEQLSGEELRALGRQRQELVSGLVARARGLAKNAGRAVTGGVLDTEVESTVRAALADPDVAREVLSGQLIHATEFTGFGPLPTSPAHDREGKSPRKATDPTHDHGKRGRAGAGAAAGAARKTAAERKQAEKLAKAQERLREAQDSLEAAQDEHATAEKERAPMAAELSSAQEQRDALRAEVGLAEAAHDEAAEKDEQARWRARRAAAALKAAQASVTRAREAVERVDR
ncbi:MAG: hypothetical protein ABJA93_10610 [Sporichthyaceae bacterium]